MKLLSEETLIQCGIVKSDELYHYGIPGMKHGVRRWQYEDGRFNPEGKERYFGKKSSIKDDKPEGSTFGSKSDTNVKQKYNPIKGLGKHFISKSGANKTDKFSEKLLKTIANVMTMGMTGKFLGNDKVVINSQKLGRNDSSFKAFAKQILLGNLGSDRYNIRRSKGQGMLRSYLGTKTVDRLKNLFTLGQNTYRQKENLGLEHSE